MSCDPHHHHHHHHHHGDTPGYSWIPTNTQECRSLEGRAVLGGFEGCDSCPLYIGRAHHGAQILPCKVLIRERSAYVTNDSKEIPVFDFELFCRNDPNAESLEWVRESNGSVPRGAIPAGRTNTGETLYVGRVEHGGSVIPGKVHPSLGCCYIACCGDEKKMYRYDVLAYDC